MQIGRQHTATHCNTLQHTATHCNTLQHTATHCNTLQHTATHCSILQYPTLKMHIGRQHCDTQQHTATHCNTLQYTVAGPLVRGNGTTVATCCSVLQCVAMSCSVLSCCSVSTGLLCMMIAIRMHMGRQQLLGQMKCWVTRGIQQKINSGLFYKRDLTFDRAQQSLPLHRLHGVAFSYILSKDPSILSKVPFILST